MIVQGRVLADGLMAAVTAENKTTPRRLAILTCAPNFETKTFLAIKEHYATRAGVEIVVHELPSTVTFDEVKAAVLTATASADGIIIQFPFPHLPTSDLIPLVPPEYDVDVLSYAGTLVGPLPPVVGAIDVISSAHNVTWSNQSVVVIGNGRLVGRPAAAYAAARGARVTVVTKDSPGPTALETADIIILGAGVPGLLTPDQIKPGVIVFDAGTSEEGGQLVGDAHPECAEVASLFTPVPGGIGPLTVAYLFKNLMFLGRQADSRKN